MKVSEEVLIILVVAYHPEDSIHEVEIDEMLTKIIPCRAKEAAEEFKKYYRDKYPETCSIQEDISNIYG